MNEIVNSLDSFKTRFSRFTIRLSPERHAYCSFIQGILFTRLGDIVEVQEFVEGLQQLSDKKIITQTQQKLLLMTAYQCPKLMRDIQMRIFEPLENAQLISVDTELLKLRGLVEKKQQGPLDPMSPIPKKVEDVDAPMSQGTVILDPNEFLDDEYKKRQQLELESLRFAKKCQAEEEELYQHNRKSNSEEENCQICFENLYEGDWLPLEKCPHIFHNECMKESFKMNITERKFPLKCPNSECGLEVADSDIHHIVGEKLYQQYQQLTFKNYVDTNGDTVSWCPTADCSHCFFYTPEDGTRFECPICKRDYCLKCRVEWHKNMTCKEFEVSNTFSEDDKKFIDFVKGAKFKQCPKCRFWVEKNMGCDHMSCRCSYQFCYRCGGKYGDCECVKQAQERLREHQARMEQKRRKKLETMENRKKKAEIRQTRSKKKLEQPSIVARSTRSRPK